MAAGSFPLTGDYIIEAGDTYDVTIPLVDSFGTELSFTGYTIARMMLREDVDASGGALITLAVQTDTQADAGATGIVIGPGSGSTPAGSIRITIDSDETEDISFDSGTPQPLTSQRSGVYDLEIAIPADTGPPVLLEVVWRLLKGAYLVSPETTR